MMREEVEKGFFVSFDFTSDALAEANAFFRKELARLECAWLERVDAALRERLVKVNDPVLAEWQKDVDAQIEEGLRQAS